MKYIISLIALILLIHIETASYAAVSEHVLSNGMKVLVIEDHKSPIAVFQIWYKTGSVDEPTEKAGLSHLLEHMMFKGTPELGPKAISKIVQKSGGIDNAFTSRDSTVYFQIMPSRDLEFSFKAESDRMQNLILDRNDFLAERDVVMEERRMRYDNDPQNSLYEQAVSAAYLVHPYRRPVIGWMETLLNITKQDLEDYYKSHYRPDNAFLVVAGDVDDGFVMDMARKYFDNIKGSGNAQGNKNSKVLDEPAQSGQRRIYLRRDAKLPYIALLYHTPKLHDSDGYSLDVLSSILSSGKSSRLYKSLVYEKRLAANADSDYSGAMRYPFLFTIDATAAQPDADMDALESAVNLEIEDIKINGVSGFELQKAKNQLNSEFIMQQDSIFYQALITGSLEISGDYKLIDTYIENINAVTARQVQDAASKYLIDDNRTTAVLIPKGAEGETH